MKETADRISKAMVRVQLLAPLEVSRRCLSPFPSWTEGYRGKSCFYFRWNRLSTTSGRDTPLHHHLVGPWLPGTKVFVPCPLPRRMTSFSVTRWRSETSRKARIVVGSSAEGSQQPSIERKKRRLNAHVETDVAAENEDAAVAAEVRKTNSDERMRSERTCANDFHQKRKVRNCAKFDRIRKTPSLLTHERLSNWW